MLEHISPVNHSTVIQHNMHTEYITKQTTTFPLKDKAFLDIKTENYTQYKLFSQIKNVSKNQRLVDVWTTCNFMSFSTVFQSNQDVVVIMKG